MNLLDRLQLRLRRRDHLPAALRWLMTLLEYALVLLRDLLEGEISLRAMSLVYTSLLSLVPLLALAFSLLKALGVHNGLDPLLRKFLAPLGPDAGQLADHIIGFVNNVKVGVLGSVGVGLLLWTAVSLIYKVESAFNFLWGIPRSRGLPQRFSDYIAVLIVGPTLVFLALGVTASLRSSRVVASLHTVQVLGPVVLAAINVIPYLLMVAVFSFLYRFIPNTRVRVLPAVVGGVVAGVLWQTASLAFATFVAGAPNYNAIYSGFAILVLLLLWLYVGWLILLTGARLAFYVQHPARLRPLPERPSIGSRERETLALAALDCIGRRFLAGQTPLTLAELGRQIGAAPDILARALAPLMERRLLVESADGGLLPGRDSASISLVECWLAARGAEVSPGRVGERAQQAVAAFESGAAAGEAGSLRDWLAAAEDRS